MSRASALRLTDSELAGFADLAELEPLANTNSEVPRLKTRGRKHRSAWRSILKEKPQRKPSPAAAARWGFQAAKDFTADGDPSLALIVGLSTALVDAEGDGDLTALLLNLEKLLKRQRQGETAW